MVEMIFPKFWVKIFMSFIVISVFEMSINLAKSKIKPNIFSNLDELSISEPYLAGF